MDFSTLARRDLQALCKKNKIPANITNVAMVDALNSLETVEGIEEILKPAESEMEYSSIESPEKNVNTQQSVPRTSYRTSTRQKPVREEDESQQSLTRTRRGGTRRRIAGDVEEAVTGTPAVRSSRKKAPAVQLKESEEYQKNGDQMDKENKTVPQTPAAAPSTLRRGTRASTRRNMNSDLMEEKEEKTTAVQRVYSTRRSVRLSEKKAVESNPADNERTQAIKIDAFSEDMGEVSENTIVHGTDLPMLSEECLETTDDDSQALVGQNSDVSSEAVKNQKDESVSSVVDSQMLEEAKHSFAEQTVLTDLVIEEAEKSESDATSTSNNPKLDTIQDLVNEEQQSSVNVTADDAQTDPAPEVQQQSNDSISTEKYTVTNEVQDLELSFAADGKEESKENDDELEVDSIESIGEITSNYELDSEKSLTGVDFSFQNEDTAILDIVGPNDDTVEKLDTEPTDEVADKPAADSIGLSDDESDFSTDSELDSKEPFTDESEAEEEADCVGPIEMTETEADCVDPIEKTKTEPTNEELSAKSVKTPGSLNRRSPIEGNVSTLILADDDPIPNSSPLKKSLSPSPLKKSLSPSPSKKSRSKSPLTARRMAAGVLDDKENIDNSGRKLELTKEKKGKKTKKENAFEDASLRQLLKMLKEKLQISNNNMMSNEEENNVEKVVKTRPALQALPENRLAAGEVETEN